MDSVLTNRRTATERSGGKIARGRQFSAGARARTPYARPASSAVAAPPRNPNWFTGIIFPTSRVIATGATKLFTSVFGPDSSSSSSSSATDSSSEDGMDDGNDDSDGPYDNGARLNETPTSELIECFRSEPQLTAGKSEIKCVIEKLVMQETFSRKECDRLIEMIKSRVIDDSTMEEEKDGKLGGRPNRTVGDVTPELRSKAIMEAKQWIEEKKVVSSSKSVMDRRTCTLSSVALSQVTEDEVVSPVDLAKSYMRARSWTASSINYVESGTPSPIGRQVLKDETPYSVAGNSFSSSKKIYSLSSGSWNIQEEMRKVHSKATEDMLKTISSTRTDFPSFAWEHKSLDKHLLADKKVWEGGAKVHNLDLFPATESIGASLELAAGASTSHGLPASALELTGNISLEEGLSSQPIFFPSAQNQDLEGIQPVEGEGHAGSNSQPPTIPDLAVEHDPRTYSADKAETESRGNPNTNGFPISGSSFGAGGDEQVLRSSDDKSPKPVGSNLDKSVDSVPMEETCELLSEASMEVPVINETNGSAAAGGSQGSSTMQCEELSHELSQSNPEDSLVGKPSTTFEKQRGRKVSSRYNRKVRGKR